MTDTMEKDDLTKCSECSRPMAIGASRLDSKDLWWDKYVQRIRGFETNAILTEDVEALLAESRRRTIEEVEEKMREADRITESRRHGDELHCGCMGFYVYRLENLLEDMKKATD